MGRISRNLEKNKNEKMLEVLIIKNDPFLLETSGQGSQARHIIYSQHLKKLFVITNTVGGETFFLKPGQNFYLYPTSSKHRAFFIPSALKIAHQIIRKSKIRVIVTQDPFECGLVGWLLSGRYKIPLNVELRADTLNNPFYLREKKINYLLNELAKFILKRAHSVDVPSMHQRRKIASLLQIPAEKIFVVPSPVDFTPPLWESINALRKSYLGKKFKQIVLSLGRIEKQKDFPTLLKAIKIVIKKLPQTLFLIVGEGRELKRLKEMSQEEGLKNNLIFTGFVSYDKIPIYYGAADLFVMSSVYEGLPKTLQEAGFSQKTAVCTNFGGVEDIIRNNETGFIVPLKDFEALAERIIYSLEHPEQIREMGRKFYQFVSQKFSFEKNVEKYIEKIYLTAQMKNEEKNSSHY
jgi:glycosyltransferase involved in cell wall biosynthesis